MSDDGATDPRSLLAPVLTIARRAAAVIASLTAAPGQAAAQRRKADGTPVTDADEAAEREIETGLLALTPDVPIIGEEAAAAGSLPKVTGRYFWLVDPLDGTKEFLAGTPEYSVNIALVRDGVSVLGVIAQPTSGRCWTGGVGMGAEEIDPDGTSRSLVARAVPKQGAVVITSSRVRAERLDAWIAANAVVAPAKRTLGSSLKFCEIAAARADLYPRLGLTMEWDTAAGQAILEAAGGQVLTPIGIPLAYGKPGYANAEFVARGQT